MTELQERVVARLVSAQNAQDPAGLRGDDAVNDALALLCEAAPSPAESVDLESVAAVFWTFWFRHEGPEDPDAQRNVTIALSTFGFLCPRLPDPEGLPQQLRDAFDPADPSSETGFEHLMSSVFGENALAAPGLTDSERLVTLDRALAWSDTAQHYLPPGHEGFVQLALYAVRLHAARFQLAADPDSLAVAARNAAAVCERLPTVAPNAIGPAGADAPAFALGAVLDAARLIGDPPLSEVERLAALVPDALHTPGVADALASLRQMYAEPVDWPGELDLRAGVVIVDAGASEHDAGRIACGVRRLRAALLRTPPGHPARAAVTMSLSRGLDAFATERGESDAGREAAREAAELLGTVETADAELLSDLAKFHNHENPGEDPALLDGIVTQLRARAAREGEPPDIDLEVLDLAHAIGAEVEAQPVPVSISDERIAGYRAALATLPADHPHRYAYVAVLAALTGVRAAALRAAEGVDAAIRADQLGAEAEALTEEVVAAAPADFLPLGLLRQGQFDFALSIAVGSIPSGAPGEAPDPELVRVVSLMSRIDSMDLTDPEHLDTDIGVLRELLAETGETGEAESGLRASLAAGLGSALAAQGAGDRGVPEDLEEIVQLLRYARTRDPELGEAVDQLLASSLTTWSTMRFDGDAAREASALLATAATSEGPPADAALVVSTFHTEVHTALQNYLLGHEPGQLVRALDAARRLKEYTAEPGAVAGDDLPGFDVMGDVYIDLIGTMGPGGGPKPDITDAEVERCRRTFAASPGPGHPMWLMAGTTLVRALAQRATAIHGTGIHGTAAQGTAAERAAEAMSLVGEAADLVDVMEGESPDGWADMMRFFVGLVANLVTGGGVAAGTAGASAPGPPSMRVFEAALERLRSTLPGFPGPTDPTARNHPVLPAWLRAHGEIGEAAGAVRRGDTGGALTHLEAAVEAMVEITDRGSDQQSAEHGLQTFEGDIRSVVELVLVQTLGQAATGRMDELSAALEEVRRVVTEEGRLPDSVPAAAEVEALFHTVRGPDVDRATEILERGRGLLLSRRIEARADLGELTESHPELSSQFERLTDQLTGTASVDGVGGVPPGHAEWSRLAGLRASRELDGLVTEIRTRPGFEGFLRPLSAGQLRALAGDGPIVVLNHARIKCQALIVTDRSITARVLDVTSDDVADMARRMRDAVDAINAQGTSRPSPLELVAAGATIRETLAWTWHRIVRPVLEIAGSCDPVPDGGAWPRIWWVPTGAFNTLPLHAAQCALPGCELGGCGAALDTVMSSYVPGFQTLAYARSRAGHREGADSGSALLVAAPEEELPGVAAAAGYAAGLLGAREPLVGAAASREAVLAALGATSWVHFGCHAATDPAEPSGALLHLPNGETLSVLEICRTRVRSAQLAFLAACGTARTSERLSDEAIHITSAFLLAGFPTAVGTLWAIDSSHADQVTRDFYRRMTDDGTTATPSAHALHHTVRELRRRIPDRPHVWAAYVHAGT
ncbi:CHAT domain-containing protein [Streptomyces niveus]|uniref:CHAT domain-containing protein n=1 Tax=Streptomyces niveus TaxID=193462 RepID=A0ABZ2A6K8_STRNV|nr:CHAT domain-containing protein [Streptomyces niveus]